MGPAEGEESLCEVIEGNHSNSRRCFGKAEGRKRVLEGGPGIIGEGNLETLRPRKFGMQLFVYFLPAIEIRHQPDSKKDYP